MKKIASVLSTLRNVLDGARRDLNDIRDRIADLKEQRQRTAGAPASLAEIETRIAGEIERVRADRAPSRPFGSTAEADGRFYASDFNNRFKDNPFALLCWLDPNALKARLLADVPKDGITESARKTTLAKLDAEILAAEMAEEVVLREIESGTGSPMPRRADADPKVLVAPTNELQG